VKATHISNGPKHRLRRGSAGFSAAIARPAIWYRRAQAVRDSTVTDPPFEVRTSRVGVAAIVTIVGEIDMANAPEVKGAIDASRDGAERVVVDLSAVTFLDSSALNALVHSQRDLAEHEISFRVVSPADQSVRKVFEITHLTEPLSVVGSLDDALAQ
jgi:anti-sigma B factor antagonist